MAGSALTKKLSGVKPAPVPPSTAYVDPYPYGKPTPGPVAPTGDAPTAPLPPPKGSSLPPRLPGPEPGPTQPFPADSPKAPATAAPVSGATGNPRLDILGLLNSKYPSARPADLSAAMAEIQAMYPGTVQIGDDKIRLPNGQVIDVGLSFGAGGGVGWWWGVS